MLDWLIDNADLVANLASLAMLVVWAFYAVLFYREFQRQRRPFFVIHQAQGHGLDSTCLIVNLSREPIHVLCVMLMMHTDRGVFAQRIRNFRRPTRTAETGGDVQTAIKQGPLTAGAFLGLGSFEAMLDAALDDTLRESGHWDEDGRMPDLHDLVPEVRELEIRLVALHGARESPVGAVRSFRMEWDDERVTIYPSMLLTRQMSSRRQTREVKQWFEDCLPYPIPGPDAPRDRERTASG